ncbi:hypothetical protein [Micromonospora aurantiaca (nom. illeg.)]|uniref:hypothetical protein n=1 Tax=Micromonospora aurantiaca (nom. illeg.) TaxID=47850 RepID=UPI003411C00B
MLAAPIPSQEGTGALLASFGQIAAHPEQYHAADAAGLGSMALDMLTATFVQMLDLESSVPAETQNQVLRARVEAFIDSHLGDADLSPADVAAAHHISVRTLHRLF